MIKKKKCAGYQKIPSVIDKKERIIAIGDVHGDFDFLIHLLKIARVIENIGEGKYKWIGGQTHVVQLGDVIDSCRPEHYQCSEMNIMENDKAEDMKIIDFLDNLHKQAIIAGGAVISLLGNHELMNIEGNMDYVSRANLDDVGGMEKRIKIFSKDGDYGRKLICTHPPAVIIGSNLFVHAGILPDIISKLPDMRHKLESLENNIIDKLTLNEIIYVTVKLFFGGLLDCDILLKIDDSHSKKFWDINKKMINDSSKKSKEIKKIVLTMTEDEYVKSRYEKYINELKRIIKQKSSEKIKLLRSIDVINTLVQKWLLYDDEKNMIDNDINAYKSIFWTRIFGMMGKNEKMDKITETAVCNKYLKPTLEFFNVKKMIIAHTPQFMENQSGINMTCENSISKEGLWRIDIGGAEVFDKYDSDIRTKKTKMKQRVPHVLEILDDVNFKICA